MTTNSTIRKVLDSTAETLAGAEYFRTVPTIPVIVEDTKDIEGEVARASQTQGVFAIVAFESCEVNAPDAPGPYLENATITVSVCEIPSVWRNKGGPSATEIAESVMRILHHTQPFDNEDNAIVPSAMLCTGVKTDPNDSMMIVRVSFSISIPLSNETPTR